MRLRDSVDLSAALFHVGGDSGKDAEEFGVRDVAVVARAVGALVGTRDDDAVVVDRKTPNFDDGITTGRLDTRYQGPDFDRLASSAQYDPQSDAISSAYTTAINQYMRTDLKYGENWTYKTSAYGEPGFKWPFRNTESGPNVMTDLARTMVANPKTKVLLAGGYYDLATPYFEGKFEMHHLPIPHSLQANISYRYYQAGHMIYVNDAILKQFHADVAAFIQATEAAK